jgi:putative transposase
VRIAKLLHEEVDTLTHDETAIDDIATRLQGTHASLTSPIADILAAALQELIEAELTVTIGAEHGERSPSWTAQRNGRRAKLLSTPVGDIDVATPKLSEGSVYLSRSSRAAGSTRRCGR